MNLPEQGMNKLRLNIRPSFTLFLYRVIIVILTQFPSVASNKYEFSIFPLEVK